MKQRDITDSTTSPADSPDIAGKPGIATGCFAWTILASNRYHRGKKPIEELSSRYWIFNFDFDEARWFGKRIKERIEHTGLRLLSLRFKDDLENDISQLLLSEWQEVLAAEGRDAPVQWVKARNLVPGRHVLQLARVMYPYQKDPWAEIVSVEPPEETELQNLSAHELVLIDGDSFSVGNVLCRATSAPAAPARERMFYPLKDYPPINFVPQPKSTSMAHAELWYRKSASLLPRCVSDSLEPIVRIRTMLELKQRMREVAAKALIETTLKKEFISRYPVPALEELLPDYEKLEPEVRKLAVEAAVQELSAPGKRYYSEFTGGMESDHVHHGLSNSVEKWKFEENQWINVETRIVSNLVP